MEPELAEIQESLDSLPETEQSLLSLVTQPHFYKPLLISLLLMFGQQFSGINAVLFFR